VPAGPVKHHDGVLVIGQRRCEAPQELAHCRGGDGGQHQAEIPPGRGFDGGEDVGERVALIDRPGRTAATQPPAAAAASLLTESGFILEKQGNPFAGKGAGYASEGCRELVF